MKIQYFLINNIVENLKFIEFMITSIYLKFLSDFRFQKENPLILKQYNKS